MLNKLFLLWISTIFVFTACEKKPLEVEITTDIQGNPISLLIFTNPIEGISDTIDMTTAEPYNLKLGGKANLVTMVSGRTRQYIYVEPGAKIKISRAVNKREFEITGDFVAEQELLKKYERVLGRAMGDFGPNKIMRVSLDSFNLLLKQKYEGLTLLHDQSKESGLLSQKLLSWISKRIEAAKVQEKVDYPGYHYYFLKKESDIGDDYYAFVEDFDFNNKEQYYFEEVRRAAESAMAYEINYEVMASPAEYFVAKFDVVSQYVSDADIADYFRHSALIEKLKFSGGIDGIEKQVNDFLASSKSVLRKNGINAEVARWSKLRKGLAAPNFTAYTRDGQEVKLSDLKGKNVYIDVWATWCGPCIREIPSLKLMEEKYHGKNIEFVSVSIDIEKDKQKWMDFVKDRELGGTQIMAENAWQSTIAQNYNINSIPRFIMVDKAGKMVSVDAPRPSAEREFDSMLAGVLD